MHKTRHGFIDIFSAVRDDDRSRSRSASKVQLKVGRGGRSTKVREPASISDLQKRS